MPMWAKAQPLGGRCSGSMLRISKTPEEATEHFGWFAHFAALDNRASSRRTREQLGWQPKQPGLISDIDRPSYFEL